MKNQIFYDLRKEPKQISEDVRLTSKKGREGVYCSQVTIDCNERNILLFIQYNPSREYKSVQLICDERRIFRIEINAEEFRSKKVNINRDHVHCSKSLVRSDDNLHKYYCNTTAFNGLSFHEFFRKFCQISNITLYGNIILPDEVYQ